MKKVATALVVIVASAIGIFSMVCLSLLGILITWEIGSFLDRLLFR